LKYGLTCRLCHRLPIQVRSDVRLKLEDSPKTTSPKLFAH
jgi:hypothetical protein